MINVNVSDEIVYFFGAKSSKSRALYTVGASEYGPATSPVLDSHVRLAATALDSGGRGQRPVTVIERPLYARHQAEHASQPSPFVLT